MKLAYDMFNDGGLPRPEVYGSWFKSYPLSGKLSTYFSWCDSNGYGYYFICASKEDGRLYCYIQEESDALLFRLRFGE